MRDVPQEAAEPTTPPTIALPIKIAPPTTIGAILTSGSGSDEKEITCLFSTTVFILYIIFI
jgi:hypothetical protein